MSSQKKVIVRQTDGNLLWGYLPATNFLKEKDAQVLDTSGRVHSVPISSIKSIAYVKDFNLDDLSDPERLGRKSFPGRPRANGLWLRLSFTDRDAVEGLAPFEFAFVDSLIEDRCVAITPPDPKSNTYRLLVPREALARMEVLGLVSPPVKKLKSEEPTLQAGLFGET